MPASVPPPSISSTGLPTPLQAVLRQLAASRPEGSNLDALTQVWQAGLAEARKEIPGLFIGSEGGDVHLGGLSPGCQACKAGTWDCIFITPQCNLNCAFCYSPQAVPGDYVGSVFGTTPEQVAANHARTHITGVSFSGGEPFLEPGRLLEWVSRFTGRSPRLYTWVYTNGLLAEEGILRDLAGLGLDEIRFNTAATDYDHLLVMQHIASAARFIPNVTVEIPAIPAHEVRLLSCLPGWSARGVRYLNLHELIYEPGSPSGSMAGKRQPVILADGHRTAIDPQSRSLTWKVMTRVASEKIPLAVNDCSLQSKLLQVRGRRRSLSPLTAGSCEKLVGSEVFESFCLVRNENDYHFVHPDELPVMRPRFPGCRVFRLVREAPLALHAEKRWLACEEC